MDINKVKESINSKTKAIIILHYAGYPCMIDAEIKICKNKNILIIEDVDAPEL